MKSNYLVLMLLLSAFLTGTELAKAQENSFDEDYGLVSLNPLSFAVGHYSLNYEMYNPDNMLSFTCGGGLIYRSNFLGTDETGLGKEDLKVYGWSIKGELRKYYHNESMDLLYPFAGAGIRVYSLNYTYTFHPSDPAKSQESDEGGMSIKSPTIFGGLRYTPVRRVAIEVFAGLYYNFTDYQTSSLGYGFPRENIDSVRPDYFKNGLGLSYGINLGYQLFLVR